MDILFDNPFEFVNAVKLPSDVAVLDNNEDLIRFRYSGGETIDLHHDDSTAEFSIEAYGPSPEFSKHLDPKILAFVGDLGSAAERWDRIFEQGMDDDLPFAEILAKIGVVMPTESLYEKILRDIP